MISVWPHIFLYNYLSGRIFEDEIGSVKKKEKSNVCDLSFYIGYFGDSFERKKTARRQEPILGLRGLFW